jgi:hypothetical protein
MELSRDFCPESPESVVNLILADAALPDMDGSTVIDILRRLPSTETVPSMLLQPRSHAFGGKSAESPLEPYRLNSSALLRQVALALAVCHAQDRTPPPEFSHDEIDTDEEPCQPC